MAGGSDRHRSEMALRADHQLRLNSVPVLVVHVRHVRMCMHERAMPMSVYVGLARRIVWPMGMLMMFIMRVCVQMSCRLMAVDLLVALRDVNPYAERHQRASGDQRHGNRLT